VTSDNEPRRRATGIRWGANVLVNDALPQLPSCPSPTSASPRWLPPGHVRTTSIRIRGHVLPMRPNASLTTPEDGLNSETRLVDWIIHVPIESPLAPVLNVPCVFRLLTNVVTSNQQR